MQFPTLYKRTSTGAVQTWTIEVRGNSYVTRSGQLGGAIRETKPTICEAKNVGKVNATTAEEQALVEAQACYDKQLKSKYKTDIANIDTKNFISPTLASPLKDRKKPIIYPALIQIKYNGVCCIIDKEFGSRSRKGEIFYNIKHINKELEQFFIDNPDIVLHGELYNYDLRENLNRLIKLVAVTRKEKDLTPELIAESEQIVQYYVYDGYIKGKESDPYDKRIKEIHDKLKGLKYVIPAPTFVVNSEEDTIDFFDKHVADGQEGAILRMTKMPYVNKRSKDILKIKQHEDIEVTVVGFEGGTGNWVGCAKKANCILPNGKTFNSNISGTMEFLKNVWENQNQYINKIYTVDFQCYSEYGIPQLPYTSLLERNYE